jgi:hypothetical protein
MLTGYAAPSFQARICPRRFRRGGKACYGVDNFMVGGLFEIGVIDAYRPEGPVILQADDIIRLVPQGGKRIGRRSDRAGRGMGRAACSDYVASLLAWIQSMNVRARWQIRFAISPFE